MTNKQALVENMRRKKMEKRYLTFDIESRRYIGSKAKLSKWIMGLIRKHTKEVNSFADIFAGTGIITRAAIGEFDHIITNDFLYSNNIIYKAFFENSPWDKDKILGLARKFDNLEVENDKHNYFSKGFGGKYFSSEEAKKIGVIRNRLEELNETLTNKEFDILLASLIYSVDKIANTVGHYDAFRKRKNIDGGFKFRLIKPIKTTKVTIYREDTNELIRRIKADVTYVDPPYNSRQYSRFYHLLETLVKWDKPKLYGVAKKPEPENVSEYCKVTAEEYFRDLVENVQTQYIVVSYNNTYNSKSKSSRNKISLEQIEKILNKRGRTKRYGYSYRYFNAGNTKFDNHKEMLFITKT